MDQGIKKIKGNRRDTCLQNTILSTTLLFRLITNIHHSKDIAKLHSRGSRGSNLAIYKKIAIGTPSNKPLERVDDTHTGED